jgi:hypothetical protein
MFIYGADFFVFKPGMILLALGLLLTLPLSFGAVTVGSVTFSLYWMLLGVTLSVLGLQSIFFGCLAQVLCDYTGKSRRRWLGVFRYTRAMGVSGGLIAAGLGAAAGLIYRYLSDGLVLPPAHATINHLAVTGVLFMIMGFMTFVFTLLLHATGVRYGQVDAVDD